VYLICIVSNRPPELPSFCDEPDLPNIGNKPDLSSVSDKPSATGEDCCDLDSDSGESCLGQLEM